MKFFKKRKPKSEVREPAISLFWVDQSDPQELTKKYALVDQFFDELIKDPTRFKLSQVPAEDSAEHAVLIAVHGNELVGAIWAGAPLEEAQQAQIAGMWQGQAKDMTELARAMLDHTWMLFDLAVAPSHRGWGLAKVLLRHVVEKANARPVDYLWGVASADSIGFYKSVGMSVMPAEGALVISHMPSGRTDGRPTVFSLPIVGESRWIFAQLQEQVHLGIGYVEQSVLDN